MKGYRRPSFASTSPWQIASYCSPRNGRDHGRRARRATFGSAIRGTAGPVPARRRQCGSSVYEGIPDQLRASPILYIRATLGKSLDQQIKDQGFFFPQRAAAAFFAIETRSAFVNFCARALPPASPPSRASSSRFSAVRRFIDALPPKRPSAAACGFFSLSFMQQKGSIALERR